MKSRYVIGLGYIDNYSRNCVSIIRFALDQLPFPCK